MAKAITDVALIGLGAVGAAYLTSVADNFPECRIRVIAAGERAARLRAGGIVYNGRRYMFDVAEPQDGTPAGLLFVSVKNGQLSEAVGQAAAFVGPDTVIISPLNGVTSERKLAERFGAENVVYSYAIKLDATRRGSETVCGNEGWIVFGDAHNAPGRLSENVLAVEEFFKRSRIEYEIPEDMIKSLWKKFMMNCGLNQTSSVLGFNYGLMQRSRLRRRPGTVAVAAAMFNKVPIAGKKTICLISGGNIDVNILSRVIGRGLQKSGRSCSMTIELVDKPGQLQHVSQIIASTGANVVSVYHERVSHTTDINGCYLHLEMETRNQQQINEIRQLLAVAGYKIVEG